MQFLSFELFEFEVPVQILDPLESVYVPYSVRRYDSRCG